MVGSQVAEKSNVDELQSLYILTDRLYRTTSLDEVFEAGLDAITSTLGCTRASILLFDDDEVMRFKATRGLSADYRRQLEGHTPWSCGELFPTPIFVTDIDETEEPDWIKKIIRREDIRSLGFFPLTVRGRVVGKFMTYYANRRVLSGHEMDLAVTIARQVGFSVERLRAEEQRQATEAALRDSAIRFRLMSEDAPVMIWMSDRDGSCLHLNRMLRTAWGVSEEDVTTFDWHSTMHPDDAEHITAEVVGATVRQQPFSVTGRYRTVEGDYRTLTTTARPYSSATGEFLGMIGVNVDITEQEEAAAQREMIFNELNHRVKNTLALVQAIAHQTLKGAEGNRLAGDFHKRLASLAAAHSLLTKANWESAPLKELLTDALAVSDAAGARIELNGPHVRLSPKQSLAVAMAIHELNTNAMKYGALSCDSGTVLVEWRLLHGSELELTWTERGGPAVEAPSGRGFGTFMIERVLANDLDGEVILDFRKEGLRCTVRAPLQRGPQ